MVFERAYMLVANAGRELGSGPAEASKRLTDAEGIVTWLTEQNCPVNNARAIALGVSIGLVMAEDPIAMQTLDNITKEWRQQ